MERELRVALNVVLACTFGWWRTIALVASRYGLELFESKEWLEVGRGMGLREARGLSELIQGGRSDVERLAEALRSSHWALLEKIKVDVGDREVRFRVYDCTARRALAKWGLEAYRCVDFTASVIEGFLEGLGIEGRAELVYGPPHPPKGELYCEWSIKLKR